MMGTSACWPGGHLWHAHWGPRGRHRRRQWWAGALHDPPPRAERGEVRYLVLDAISDQPRHGYEIIQHIEERAQGGYRPSPGVIYPTLQLLDELGHAEVVDRDGRKVYGITDSGRQELDANRPSVSEFYDRFGESNWEAHADDLAELMQGVGRLVRAFKRGTRRGPLSATTVRAIRKTLDEALDKIEAALDGDKR